MQEDLDDEMVKRIWEHSVIPYIEERRFQGDSVSGEFNLDRIRQEVNRAGDTDQTENEFTRRRQWRCRTECHCRQMTPRNAA